MTDNIVDLWPEGIEYGRTVAPATILRQQASLLAKKTSNLVQGEVVDKSSTHNSFVYQFFLVAPGLNNYSYLLLTCYHDIALYPLTIETERSIMEEVQVVERATDEYGDVLLWARDQDEYEKALRGIFGSSKSIQVITSLLSQSDPEWSGDNLTDTKARDWKDEDIPF